MGIAHDPGPTVTQSDDVATVGFVSEGAEHAGKGPVEWPSTRWIPYLVPGPHRVTRTFPYGTVTWEMSHSLVSFDHVDCMAKVPVPVETSAAAP